MSWGRGHGIQNYWWRYILPRGTGRACEIKSSSFDWSLKSTYLSSSSTLCEHCPPTDVPPRSSSISYKAAPTHTHGSFVHLSCALIHLKRSTYLRRSCRLADNEHTNVHCGYIPLVMLFHKRQEKSRHRRWIQCQRQQKQP